MNRAKSPALAAGRNHNHHHGGAPPSRSPSRGYTGRSSSVTSYTSVASSSVSKTSYSLAKAQKETERELQKHLQSLLQMRHRLRRAHDGVAKEYSTLVAAVKEVEETRALLQTEMQRTHEMRNAAGAVDDEMRNHALLVHGHVAQLEALSDDAARTLTALTLNDRQVQHLMVLVDRATDIDMQCLDGRVPDTVITNGSPLFPHLTVNDADAVADEAGALGARGGRVATALKRACATAKGEIKHSGQQLDTNITTRARIHAQAALGAGRNLEGLKYESGRLQKQKATVLEELEAIGTRLSHIQRTISLRLTAKDAIFSKAGGDDPVVAVMQREVKELQERRSELEDRLRGLNDALGAVEKETLTQSDHAALATHRTESYSNAASYRATSASSPAQQSANSSGTGGGVGSFSKRGTITIASSSPYDSPVTSSRQPASAVASAQSPVAPATARVAFASQEVPTSRAAVSTTRARSPTGFRR